MNFNRVKKRINLMIVLPLVLLLTVYTAVITGFVGVNMRRADLELAQDDFDIRTARIDALFHAVESGFYRFSRNIALPENLAQRDISGVDRELRLLRTFVPSAAGILFYCEGHVYYEGKMTNVPGADGLKADKAVAAFLEGEKSAGVFVRTGGVPQYYSGELPYETARGMVSYMMKVTAGERRGILIADIPAARLLAVIAYQSGQYQGSKPYLLSDGLYYDGRGAAALPDAKGTALSAPLAHSPAQVVVMLSDAAQSGFLLFASVIWGITLTASAVIIIASRRVSGGIAARLTLLKQRMDSQGKRQ